MTPPLSPTTRRLSTGWLLHKALKNSRTGAIETTRGQTHGHTQSRTDTHTHRKREGERERGLINVEVDSRCWEIQSLKAWGF